MKSLHAWILLCIIGTLSLALLVLTAISNHVLRTSLYPVFEAADELELEQAREALRQGGRSAVAVYMQHLDQLFGARHHLLNANGIDVASGRDLKLLLPKEPAVRKSRLDVGGKLIITHESADGQYWFVAVDPRHRNRWTFLPYYLLVIGVTAIIYWSAAIGVLHPIQRITGALTRFGQGDLTVRLEMKRPDEIGVLAERFNKMAERIEMLLAGERRLLTDISHELRSPLTRLKFAIKLAEANPSSEGNFDRVRRQVDRISALVSELTELTRAEGDPASRKLELVRLQEVIEETVRDCQLEAQSRGCLIELHGRLVGLAPGDGELLRRALENVLRNAIRYSPKDSAIRCDLTETPGWATIAIRDYGPGVPNECVNRLFEPFFRVEEARDSESGGMGLGLAIAKRAVEVHQGTITASNANPGLLMQFNLPLANFLSG